VAHPRFQVRQVDPGLRRQGYFRCAADRENAARASRSRPRATGQPEALRKLPRAPCWITSARSHRRS
jgi:hypothetical protein